MFLFAVSSDFVLNLPVVIGVSCGEVPMSSVAVGSIGIRGGGAPPRCGSLDPLAYEVEGCRTVVRG